VKRDSQRQKVYNAEFSALSRDGLMSLDECQAYIDSITKTAWWRHRSRLRHVEVVAGARNGRAWAHYGRIRTSPGSRSKPVLLHELSHNLTPNTYDVAAHGPEFCANLLALVRQFLGEEEAEKLKASLKSYKVKVRGASRVEVRRVHCIECDRMVSERGAWRLRHETYWFCTRRCGEKWIKGRLERVD